MKLSEAKAWLTRTQFIAQRARTILQEEMSLPVDSAVLALIEPQLFSSFNVVTITQKILDKGDLMSPLDLFNVHTLASHSINLLAAGAAGDYPYQWLCRADELDEISPMAVPLVFNIATQFEEGS